MIEADQAGLADVVWGGRPLADAERSGEVRVEGGAAAAERFLALFSVTPA